MIHYLYQITNLVNNKIYVGVHITNNLNDGYMGSGKVIKRAIEKYGIDNFRKDILEYFENAESMYAREKEIVTNDFLLREDVYNLRRGGNGGFDYINANPEKYLTEKRLSCLMPIEECQRRFKEKWNNDPEFRIRQSENSRKRIQSIIEKYPEGTFKNRKHTPESLQKMKQSAVGRGAGELNSQYGTRWIYNTELRISKRISKTDPLPQGWFEGRKIKF